jgi:hypothetical protein
MSTRPSATKPLRAASGPDRFRFFWKKIELGGPRFDTADPETLRDGRWSEWSTGARMVAVDVAIAHR